MSRSPNDWHDHDYRTGAPGGTADGLHPQVSRPEGGHPRARKNTQSADPTIKDQAHHSNIQAHASERNGPAGIVRVGRAYPQHDYAATGRNVRLLPSAKGNTDMRRQGGS